MKEKLGIEGNIQKRPYLASGAGRAFPAAFRAAPRLQMSITAWMRCYLSTCTAKPGSGHAGPRVWRLLRAAPLHAPRSDARRAAEVSDVYEADKWRQQILREISRKVMEIQNAALGEHKLRDLNDEINKLLREKGHWERRIVELGGPDYR